MKTIYMPVLPKKMGSVSVTVSATSFMGKDTVTKSMNVIVSRFRKHRLKIAFLAELFWFCVPLEKPQIIRPWIHNFEQAKNRTSHIFGQIVASTALTNIIDMYYMDC